MSVVLTEADHRAVSDAVAAAEQHTAGEIATVVAGQSDAYHDVALHWAVMAMLLTLALFAWRPAWAERLHALVAGDVWNATATPGALFATALIVVALVFLVVRAVLAAPTLRLMLTPGGTKARRVRRRALLLFRVGTERRTRGRTGVLIYLSLAERRAEIVADAAIHAKVDDHAWGAAMHALLTEVRDGRPGVGLGAAIEQVGVLLATHFPRGADDINELPDRLISL